MALKKQKLVRVGLIGESPNDTAGLKVLLLKKYADRIQVHVLLKNQRGDKAASLKSFRMLPAECDELRIDLVVFTRDLDALASDAKQQKRRQQEFDDINKCVAGKGVFLLHIYEFEALFMAHIGPFNAHYKCDYKPPGDPMRIPDPKGKLQAASRKGKGEYSENDCAIVCAKLDYAELIKNCAYFRDFDAALAARLA